MSSIPLEDNRLDCACAVQQLKPIFFLKHQTLSSLSLQSYREMQSYISEIYETYLIWYIYHV